jgi:hypothetical protein
VKNEFCKNQTGEDEVLRGKFKQCALIALTIALTGASAEARAETIFLKCGSFDFTVDLTHSTVNNLPAMINATAIDWVKGPYDAGSGYTAKEFYHIDRAAGTVTRRNETVSPSGEPGPAPLGSTDSCTAGSAPATIF